MHSTNKLFYNKFYFMAFLPFLGQSDLFDLVR